MDTRERIKSVWEGKAVDHVPLTTWCFGFPAPPGQGWRRDGRDVRFWYSKRMEHIHTLPQSWDLDDDFRRALAWQSLGIDDVLDVSVPWSASPEATWRDSRTTAADGSPLGVREYRTPAGPLRHAIRLTGEAQAAGWVTQPGAVQLFEDFNIPRAETHVINVPEDVDRVGYLYRPPDADAQARMARRMDEVGRFARERRVPVQAWSAFGMDAVVWLAGTQGAVLMALDHPEAFSRLLDAVTEADLGRTELAASFPEIDLIVERGWYSSTDFWSPALFDRYLAPRIAQLSRAAHRQGKRFGYVMTTGVETLGPRLADAGVDVLYFVDPRDPVQPGVSLARLRDLLARRMTLVGGLSSITLASGDPTRVEADVRNALDVLGSTGRFILHPVDALFPDTPWEGVRALIEAWKKYR
jgi:hypothetical protein